MEMSHIIPYSGNNRNWEHYILFLALVSFKRPFVFLVIGHMHALFTVQNMTLISNGGSVCSYWVIGASPEKPAFKPRVAQCTFKPVCC